MLRISLEEAQNLPLRPFLKQALLRARPLTLADYETMGGVISTLENPAVNFEVGDYLCVGVKGELWPTRNTTFEQNFVTVSAPDPTGFSQYRRITATLAIEINEAFQVQIANGNLLSGKPGDFLVRHNSDLWIVDREIFNLSYAPLEQ